MYLAYFLVHSRAMASYLTLDYMYCRAISGTNGSYGSGSSKNELIESKIFCIVNAGHHSSSQYIQTNLSFFIYIRVIYFSNKIYF